MFDEKNEIRWYFSLENGFLLLTNLSLSRKSGPQQQQQKRMKKRRIRERLAKNVRSLPWKMELYIWNIWQNSRPFTWMIFYKAPLPPSIFIITNDGKDGILGDVLCFALPLSLDRSLFRDTLNESSQLDVEFVYELRMWTLNKSPINQHLFKQSLE